MITIRKDSAHEVDGKKGWISFVGVRSELQAGQSELRSNPLFLMFILLETIMDQNFVCQDKLKVPTSSTSK